VIRSISVLLLLASGCHEVSSTGAYGIRGRLKDHVGHDLSFVRVVSEEHGVTTESDGRFAVRWKDPATFVDMRVGGVTWRRKWLPETDSGEVEVRLPETGEGTISCRTDMECMAELTWDGGPGLTGRLDVECGDTAVVKLAGLPRSEPTVTCPTILGDQEMAVKLIDDRLIITGKPLPVPVRIQGVEDPSTCTVRILDGEVIRGGGIRGLQPTTETFAWALCKGRPGTPVQVRPRPRGKKDADVTVTLPWASGPDLTLAKKVPEPRTLTLVRRTPDEAVDWKLTIEPADDQRTYRLPHLPRGEYRMGLGSGALFGNTHADSPEVPGLVYLLREGQVWGKDGGMVGALLLEEDLGEGQVKVEVQRAHEGEDGGKEKGGGGERGR